MATIIIFASSLFLATLMVIMKAIELKCGKKNAALSCLCRLDSKSEKIISSLKFKALQLIQSVRYIILVEIREIVKNWFHDIKEKILDEYRARHNMIMGQKEILGNGSASFYLKKITEHKGNGEKGKIEETM